MKKFIFAFAIGFFLLAGFLAIIPRLYAQAQNTNMVSDNERLEDDGHGVNKMSCDRRSGGSLKNGALACYGLWDYGDSFGDDSATCGGLDPMQEGRSPTGCVIPASMCKSGRAIAYDFYKISDQTPSKKIRTLSQNLGASKAVISSQLIHIWEYACTEKPLSINGLRSTIDASVLQNDYGPREPAWSFVGDTSSVIIVGVYESTAKDNSIKVYIPRLDRPSLLVLSAYNPVKWRLIGPGVINVAGILVNGYYDQKISRVIPTLPFFKIKEHILKIKKHICEKDSSPTCFFPYEKDSKEFYQLQDYLLDKTGYFPHLFFGEYGTSTVIVHVTHGDAPGALNKETPEANQFSSQKSVQPSSPTSDTGATSPGMKTYTSQQYGFQFDYPASLTVKPVQTRELKIRNITETIPLPAGSLEVAGHFIVSPVPYSEFSKEKPIYNYLSCCSGMRYWFNTTKSQWQANTITEGQYKENGNLIPDPKTPLLLSSNGSCTLEQKFGSNVFYKIESGDEGIATDVYYFLPTNQGYAIRFLTSDDVRRDIFDSGESVRPDPKMLQTIEKILSSVTLVGDTTKLKASCL